MKTLCDLSDLVEGTACSFEFSEGASTQEVVLVRKAHRVYGWLNRCPHQGMTLNWFPGQFLSSDGEYIQCTNHDALFRIDDGLCVAGPCSGMSLSPVAVKISGGQVMLAEEQGD